jgi:2-aminoadipate transaminase
MSTAKASIGDLVSDRVKAAPAPYFEPPPEPLVYDFNAGDPPPETFPLEELKAYLIDALDRAGTQLTKYNPTWRQDMVRGDPGLRERIAERLSRRDGRTVDADWIMLCHGSSDGLALAARGFLSPGDAAIVEAATFPYMVGYMRATGAEIATVPVDRDGMVVDAIEDRLRRLEDDGLRPKLIYVIPTFHVPTGSLMPLARREKLLEIAHEWGLVVVEDNAYYDQWFDEPPPPTLFSMDDSGLVLLSETFGKQLAPGLRLGYMTGVPEAMRALDVVREDLGVNKLIPMMLDAYIADGRLDAHLERFRETSRRKRDAALAGLRKHCAPWVEFEVPSGGIYFWLKLSDEIDSKQLNALMRADGLSTRAGDGFSDDPATGAGYMRLAFQQESLEGIEKGIEALGRALAASARSADSAAPSR